MERGSSALVKYGDQASLQFGNEVDHGAKVIIDLPAQTEEEEGGAYAEPVDRG